MLDYITQMASTVLMRQINLQQWLEQRLSTPCQRQLLVIHGDMLWACQQAHSILAQQSMDNIIWVGHGGDTHHSITAKQYHQYLGREFQAVVYNCYDGMRANALGALSGTIVQGGLMILICPALDKWADFDDPQKNERISYGFTKLAKHSQFVEFLIEQIRADNSVLLLSEHDFKGNNVVLASLKKTVTPPYRSQEQQKLVERLLQLVHDKNPRPMVVTADRGRGKSSALGIAAALMLLQGVKKVLICAPTFSAVERLFFHAHELLVGAKLQHHSLHFEDKSINFQPIDRILAELPHADLLMVDEAAAIPPPLLQKLTQHYPQLIFSSTIHGYEGSGRGFELRFKPYLQANYPNFLLQHIVQPIRWQQGDPLEYFWFRSLLLKSEPVAVRYDEAQPCQFELVLQSRLIKEPKLLNQVFGLLVNSHYQTTPDDLVRLLDAPDQQLFILRQGKELLGAALSHIEGAGILDEIARDISEGKRRVRGHMLPQNLGLHFTQEQAVKMHYLRIVRIAVSANCQRQGLGIYLLNELYNYAQTKKFDFIGSSFGASNDLLRFWSDAGYQFVKLGHKKDAASGEYSAIVLKALSESAETLQKHVLSVFQKEQRLNPDKFNSLL
jgi:tRNA(Met) cytidine acetyltransferase